MTLTRLFTYRYASCLATVPEMLKSAEAMEDYDGEDMGYDKDSLMEDLMEAISDKDSDAVYAALMALHEYWHEHDGMSVTIKAS